MSISRWIAAGIAIGLTVIALIILMLWAIPQYNVYSQQLAGEAKLREAESSRQIRVLEAKARMESAQLEAQAEVERAKGVAQANQIIGSSLKNNPEYIQYLYITSLQEKEGNTGDRTVIYVPTQNGLPVLPVSEAGRAAQSPALK